jgi:hypothetical protein
MRYDDLSAIQKDKYISICGYEYVLNSINGSFQTDAPYNDHDWKLSPWHFQFEFQNETGFLFCFIGHRMTNTRSYGWDYEGNELEVPQEEGWCVVVK